jgi:hypothetical protein
MSTPIYTTPAPGTPAIGTPIPSAPDIPVVVLFPTPVVHTDPEPRVKRKGSQHVPVWVELILGVCSVLFMSSIAWCLHDAYSIVQSEIGRGTLSGAAQHPHYVTGMHYLLIMYTVMTDANWWMYVSSMVMYTIVSIVAIIWFSAWRNGRLISLDAQFLTSSLLLVSMVSHPSHSHHWAGLDMDSFITALRVRWYVYFSFQLVLLVLLSYVIVATKGFKKSVLGSWQAVAGVKACAFASTWLFGLCLIASVYGYDMMIGFYLVVSSIGVLVVVWGGYCILSAIKTARKKRDSEEADEHKRLIHGNPLLTA